MSACVQTLHSAAVACHRVAVVACTLLANVPYGGYVRAHGWSHFSTVLLRRIYETVLVVLKYSLPIEMQSRFIPEN